MVTITPGNWSLPVSHPTPTQWPPAANQPTRAHGQAGWLSHPGDPLDDQASTLVRVGRIVPFFITHSLCCGVILAAGVHNVVHNCRVRCHWLMVDSIVRRWPGQRRRVGSFPISVVSPSRYSHAMARSLWVAKLIISEATARKLSAKHGLDPREVYDAVVGVTGLRYVWHDHPDRGRRALAEVWISDRRCVVVLYPVDDPAGDVYALGSAHPR